MIVLSIEFTNKFFTDACDVLYSSLKQASQSMMTIDDITGNYIVCYSDLCALIEPMLIEIQSCNNELFAERALEVTRELIITYKNAVTEICERNLAVPLICIAGFCNVSLLIIERFKNWQIMVKSHLDASFINTYLRSKQISQEVQLIEQSSKNFFTITLLDRVDSSFERQFHELKMDVLFPQIVNELNELEGRTDKNLTTYI